ncbi:MAG: hypothetical protein MJY81_07865 [Bacteroidaceae bacterium]|nr:hypothetical protein [Bacteroidaceae bacterium]
MNKQHLLLTTFAIAAMAGFCSCSDEDEQVGNGRSIHTFTATIEGNDADTRATFNSDRLCAYWEQTDEININGKVYKATAAGATTSFVATDEDAEGETFEAFFPASLINEETLTLPAEINEDYVDGKFNMPMYATSKTNKLLFKNICGVLRIDVYKKDGAANVKSIRVSSTDKAVSGEFSVINNAAVLTNPETDPSDNAVTVTYTETITVPDAGATFFVALPAQEYTGLKVELSTDGNSYDLNGTIASATINQNTIYSVIFGTAPVTGGTAKATINSVDTDVEWVQLWAGGPKFAKYNVGVTDGKETSFGGLYCWGGMDDGKFGYDNNDAYAPGDWEYEPLRREHDTAAQLWGNNWRMPTRLEYEGLAKYCTYTWIEDYKGTGVAGMKVTGKGIYANSSVFFPAAGRNSYDGFYLDKKYEHEDRGSFGYYRTSLPSGSGCTYSFAQTFSRDVSELNSVQRSDWGCSVRAVLREPTKGTALATVNGPDTEPVPVDWVQLWASGPKIATVNVGVTNGDVTEYGGLYAWGSSCDNRTASVKNFEYHEGFTNLWGDTDTATKLWGNNWRMLSLSEIERAIIGRDSYYDDIFCEFEWKENYNGTGRNGVLVTGLGDYSDNSIFLPAAGQVSQYYALNQVGNYGFYWTSECGDYQNTAWGITIDNAPTTNMNRETNANRQRNVGTSVRAVLNELP